MSSPNRLDYLNICSYTTYLPIFVYSRSLSLISQSGSLVHSWTMPEFIWKIHGQFIACHTDMSRSPGKTSTERHSYVSVTVARNANVMKIHGLYQQDSDLYFKDLRAVI